MKSFLKQIDESFKSLEESLDSKTAANDPKLFVKTAYDNGYSEKQIENFLQKAGHSKDDAETYLYNIIGQYDTGFASNGINEAAKQSKTSKAAIQSAVGKNRDDWEYKTCENCSGKLTSHIKGVCQRCKGKYDDGDGKDEKCDYVPCNESELEEASVTGGLDGGAGPPTRPDVFAPADDDTVEALGYKRVHEAIDKKYERLIEGYKNFALNDSKKTPEQKVKESIKNVARQLKEIETTIGYTARLKTESGISHSGFKPATLKALSQISERLIKISERVRSLGE